MVSEPMHGTNFIINSLALSIYSHAHHLYIYSLNICLAWNTLFFFGCVLWMCAVHVHVCVCFYACVRLELVVDFKYLIVYIVHAFAYR